MTTTKTPSIGHLFLEFRQNLGIGQKEAGEFFDPIVHQSEWSKIERNLRWPNARTVSQLASLTNNPTLVEQYNKKLKAARYIDPEPDPEAKPKPAGRPAKQNDAPADALPAWKWMADLIETVGEPAHVVQTSNEITLTWTGSRPVQMLRYQATLATPRGDVSSAVIRATCEVVTRNKITSSLISTSPDEIGSFLFEAMKRDDESVVRFNRLVLGLTAVFAYARYKETLK